MDIKKHYQIIVIQLKDKTPLEFVDMAVGKNRYPIIKSTRKKSFHADSIKLEMINISVSKYVLWKVPVAMNSDTLVKTYSIIV